MRRGEPVSREQWGMGVTGRFRAQIQLETSRRGRFGQRSGPASRGLTTVCTKPFSTSFLKRALLTDPPGASRRTCRRGNSGLGARRKACSRRDNHDSGNRRSTIRECSLHSRARAPPLSTRRDRRTRTSNRVSVPRRSRHPRRTSDRCSVPRAGTSRQGAPVARHPPCPASTGCRPLVPASPASCFNVPKQALAASNAAVTGIWRESLRCAIERPLVAPSWLISWR